MQPRYKWFNKYQPTCKDELLKYAYYMERWLLTLQQQPNPDEWLVNMLFERIAQYRSELPKEKFVQKKWTSLLFPEFN